MYFSTVTIHFGGAAGYCPPVQKVTDYHLQVYLSLYFLRFRLLKKERKHLLNRAEDLIVAVPQPQLQPATWL